ncbi:hypothetical protein H4R21_004566 [Coemansia helicoidea]|uniref:Uncharacterized protein n=1 Tax=Coemansia helicoidea TaxID=1286919 RepID=A0ACC1KWW4_9FUNG|nr:hypothetical protein H4R21_004566 [Coemansia helicoidea]
MDSFSLLSSPPRRAPPTFIMHQAARSGGAPAGRSHRRTYRHLSSTSREARQGEQPWRQWFREQCADRLTKAREQSVMLKRQLAHTSRGGSGTAMLGEEEEDDEEEAALSEEQIGAIVRQEWARFQAEMEQQSLEYGPLDTSILDEIERDVGWHQGLPAGASNAQDEQMRELAEWEEYENQLFAEEMMEADLRDVDALLDADIDIDSDIDSDMMALE